MNVQLILRFESSEKVALGVRAQSESSEEGGGCTRTSKISRLGGNVESEITICFWHTVSEKKIIEM